MMTTNSVIFVKSQVFFQKAPGSFFILPRCPDILLSFFFKCWLMLRENPPFNVNFHPSIVSFVNSAYKYMFHAVVKIF